MDGATPRALRHDAAQSAICQWYEHQRPGAVDKHLTMVLGLGERTFSVARAFKDTGEDPFARAGADLDDDGDTDLAALDRGEEVVS